MARRVVFWYLRGRGTKLGVGVGDDGPGPEEGTMEGGELKTG